MIKIEVETSRNGRIALIALIALIARNGRPSLCHHWRTAVRMGISKGIAFWNHREKKKRERDARVASLIAYLRTLRDAPTADDVRYLAKQMKVSTGTIYRYLREELPNDGICPCCGRPYDEDQIVEVIEEILGELPAKRP